MSEVELTVKELVQRAVANEGQIRWTPGQRPSHDLLVFVNDEGGIFGQPDATGLCVFYGWCE